MKSINLITVTAILLLAMVLLNPSFAIADVHVYDDNNQYLGILIELGGEDFSVFVPSVKASYGVDYEENVDCPDTAYFENTGCTGIPYEKDHLL